MSTDNKTPESPGDGKVSRRKALTIFSSLCAGAACASAGVSMIPDKEEREMGSDEFKEHFKKNYRLMTDTERAETIQRLEAIAERQLGKSVDIATTDAPEGVLFGYAFNVSRCNGSRKCVEACVEENNQDRATNMQYIRMKQLKNGENGLEHGTAEYNHATPPAGHFFLGTQCHQCSNPACVKACPVGATWQEPDGITVVDYDWCIGCRYCQAACPYWARRFNWQEPTLPEKEVNTQQHYLGNRPRHKGVMEKCTFCVQRTRVGKNPACVQACPTGARIFGNLLDPKSDIRYVLAHKKVFRLKEELGTEPKFWYYQD